MIGCPQSRSDEFTYTPRLGAPRPRMGRRRPPDRANPATRWPAAGISLGRRSRRRSAAQFRHGAGARGAGRRGRLGHPGQPPFRRPPGAERCRRAPRGGPCTGCIRWAQPRQAMPDLPRAPRRPGLARSPRWSALYACVPVLAGRYRRWPGVDRPAGGRRPVHRRQFSGRHAAAALPGETLEGLLRGLRRGRNPRSRRRRHRGPAMWFPVTARSSATEPPDAFAAALRDGQPRLHACGGRFRSRPPWIGYPPATPASFALPLPPLSCLYRSPGGTLGLLVCDRSSVPTRAWMAAWASCSTTPRCAPTSSNATAWPAGPMR